jgi:hypothetical protein
VMVSSFDETTASSFVLMMARAMESSEG